MHENSLLRSLLSYLVGEHVCAPPDAHGEWTVIPQRLHARFASVYVCPECGQHLTRVEDVQQAVIRPVHFAHPIAASRSRSAA